MNVGSRRSTCLPARSTWLLVIVSLPGAPDGSYKCWSLGPCKDYMNVGPCLTPWCFANSTKLLVLMDLPGAPTGTSWMSVLGGRPGTHPWRFTSVLTLISQSGGPHTPFECWSLWSNWFPARSTSLLVLLDLPGAPQGSKDHMNVAFWGLHGATERLLECWSMFGYLALELTVGLYKSTWRPNGSHECWS